MEDVTRVEIVNFHMWQISNNTQDRPRSDGLEPVLSDLYSLTVASCFGILVLPIFLQKHH
jgi:hypothetical protein